MTDGVLASFADREDFASVSPPRGDLRAWVRWNIELIIRWFEGKPPTENELDRFRELGRICARNDVPPDTIPANYRIGARFAWGALVEAATVQERPALVDGADVVLAFVDRISRLYAEGYDAVVRRGESSAIDRGVQSLLARLIAGEDVRAEDHAVADRVGFRLDGPFRPFVARAPGRSAHDHVALARRLLACGALAAAHGRGVAGIANTVLPWSRLEPGPDVILADGGSVHRGELGAVLDELHAVCDVAAARGRVGMVRLDDYLPEILLHRSPRIARRLSARVYAAIDAESPELTRTLDCLIEHDFDRGRTAAALPVHRNTLTNRIHRIGALTGLDIDRGEGRALAWLAWRIRTGQSCSAEGRELPL